jgi:hypothetical protein
LSTISDSRLCPFIRGYQIPASHAKRLPLRAASFKSASRPPSKSRRLSASPMLLELIEHGVSPPAAVREPVAVLHQEVNVVLCIRRRHGFNHLRLRLVQI